MLTNICAYLVFPFQHAVVQVNGWNLWLNDSSLKQDTWTIQCIKQDSDSSIFVSIDNTYALILNEK